MKQSSGYVGQIQADKKENNYLDRDRLPQHVAIIMDGNRRWAAARRLPVFAGHKKVLEDRIEPLIEQAGKLGIKYITFWAWSSENWRRPDMEVKGIMRLFRVALKKYAERMIAKGARLKVIGDINKFPPDIRKGMEEMMEKSKNNKAITVTFALNYGGRDEVVRAARKAVKQLISESVYQLTPEEMCNGAMESKYDQLKERLESNLDTTGIPDPDLIIRPGGTKRLSGFMLWQSEYSELYFTDILMPDFGLLQFEEALVDYGKRDRRFGGGSAKQYKVSSV